MASAIADSAARRDDIDIIAMVGPQTPEWKSIIPWFASLTELTIFPDFLIDFTLPEGTRAAAAWCRENAVPLVSGVTGLPEDVIAMLESTAEKVPVLWSPNLSLGVNLLAVLVRQAAQALAASDFDIEVLEMHHKHKIDAPSGTALLLGEAAAKGRNVNLAEKEVKIRDGITGARDEGSIGFATLRGGSVIGEHSVMFAGEGETIEISHKATDRLLFARGAVKAALWARDKKAGRYDMLDVLGLERD